MVSKPKSYKIMLIGDVFVGKTCAIFRFCDKQYDDHYKTSITCDIRKKVIDLDGDAVHLEIWDTAGQERYNAVCNLSLRNIEGILLMYDITRVCTFNTLQKRIKYIEENVSCDVVKVLVGNKFDVPEEQRQVKYETGLQLANELNIPFFEVSSKADVNIDKAFLTLAKNIKKQIVKHELGEILKLEEKERNEKRSICSCNISNNNMFFRNN